MNQIENSSVYKGVRKSCVQIDGFVMQNLMYSKYSLSSIVSASGPDVMVIVILYFM